MAYNSRWKLYIFLVCEIDPHLLTAVASCNEAEILAEQAAVPQLQLRPTAEIVSPSVSLKVMILPAIGSLQFSVRS